MKKDKGLGSASKLAKEIHLKYKNQPLNKLQRLAKSALEKSKNKNLKATFSWESPIMKTIIAFTFLAVPVLAEAQTSKSLPADLKMQRTQRHAPKTADPYRTIAWELLKNCEGVDEKIAVAGFSYSDGRDSRDGGVVAERMTTELVNAKKFRVIERKEIEKVFEELKIQRSGAIDSTSAKEIGKLLGADWIVVGTLTELPNKQLELNARLVGIESGEIINAAKSQIKKDWLDQYIKLLDTQDKAIKKNDKNAKAFYERGVMYADLSEHDNAVASFALAISIDPTDLKSYSGRGNAYNNLGEYDKAIEDYSKAIAINPEYDSAYLERGFVYENKGEHNKATRDFSKAISINPGHADVYAYLGEKYFNEGEYDKAIENYSRGIAIAPEDAQLYSNRGLAYYRKNQVEKAIADYTEAITVDPRLAAAYCNRGLAYHDKTEHAKAIEDYSKAITINPEYDLAYIRRGSVYEKTGEYDKATKDFSKAISINPEHRDTVLILIFFYGDGHFGAGEYDKAIADYTMALTIDPKLDTAYYNRGKAYHGKGEHTKAIEDYSKAIAIDPKYTAAYCKRGDAYSDIVAAYVERTGGACADIEECDKAIADLELCRR